VPENRYLHHGLLGGVHEIPFCESDHLLLHREQMYPDPSHPTHPNGLCFTARDASGEVLLTQTFFSIGGGFIVTAEELANPLAARKRAVPYSFSSAEGLLRIAQEHNLSIAKLILTNEISLRNDPAILRPPPLDPAAVHDDASDIEQRILTLWNTMRGSIERGMQTEGTLPGGLNVRRRAPGLARRLERIDAEGRARDPLAPMDLVNLVAMAVNEENAAGGRVVTAPTNGAAGVIPAIASYYLKYGSAEQSKEVKTRGLLRYFLTAAAVGILYKENASISGAEVGCQGEVGVACSMAAGGLVAALGGENSAVEHAAEIAMEHNLGMTCDPIGGLVQIPCIERNGMGAVKAVNAARLALHDPGVHKISLDQVIETMYRTGMDMQSRYKETSLAGLALNIIEC
jgi:L-serine dehydratase